MKRVGRILSVCLFVIFLCIGLSISTSMADTMIGLPERAQEHNQWCWDATSQAVLEYYGTHVAQCDIANWAWGRADCCGNSPFDWSHACNQPNYMYGTTGTLQGILQHWGVNSNAVTASLTMEMCVSEINEGRPFVIRLGWSGGLGHFLDGYGYDQSAGDYLDYMDPWPGNGYTRSLYSWVVSASDHTWTDTLQITTNPSARNVYANFTGYGLYKWNGAAWSKITTAVAASMTATNTDLYATFKGYTGLYKWNGTAWSKIKTVTPVNMAASDTDLYASFTSYGLHKWNGTAWSKKITTAIAASMTATNTDLYATFKGYTGLYKWNGTAWSKIKTVTPVNMAASDTDLYASFTSYGLHKWNGTAWSKKITTAIAASMTATNTDLYATFKGYTGLYKWNGTAWSKIKTVTPANMAASGTDLYASFTGYGVYKWNGTVWSRINTAVANSMTSSR